MELIALFALNALIQWAVLMIVIPIAGRVAGFGFPGPKEAGWRLATLVVVTSVVSIALGSVTHLGVGLTNAIIFWVAMVKWFDVDPGLPRRAQGNP